MAITAGIVVDWILSVGSFVAVTVPVSLVLVARGMTTHQLETFFSENISMLVGQGLLGLVCTVIGGAVAGAVARDHRIANGLAVGIIQMLVSASLLLLPIVPTLPWWYLAVFVPATCLAGWLGGLLSDAAHQTE